jgi:hypothetical protein
MTWTKRLSYALASVAGVSFLILVGGWFLAGASLPYRTVLGSGATFVISTLGTLATMYYGWRQEGRESQEFMIKLASLAAKLKRGDELPPAR